jgi:glycerol-3-phosphate dehydrogenase
VTRESALAALSREVFDVAVVGGGIAGACAALDAAQRGLRVALIEKADFGGATSAQSLKVLHGGIRYLQHLDIVRLRESCAERSAFLKMAPHLTRPLPFALPTYGHGLRGKLPLYAAFKLLDLFTAGRNRHIEDESQQIPSPYLMSRGEFVRRFPAFEAPGLTGAGVFYDGQILNPPRLVFSCVATAIDCGAVALNYCAAERLILRGNSVEALRVRDCVGGEAFDLRARCIVNLSGPFAAALHRRLGGPGSIDVPLSRDMAIVLRRDLLADMGLGIQTRYRDPDAWLSRGNRHLFLAPWRRHTLIGVSSRVYEGDPSALTVAEPEVNAFIGEVNDACPALAVKRDEVEVVNAGLLPFGENQPGQTNLSFGKRSILMDHAERGELQGLVTGMSVRWTMGRLLGEQAIDLAAAKLGQDTAPSRTALTPVAGGDFCSRRTLLGDIEKAVAAPLPKATVQHLANTFGTLSSSVLRLEGATTLLPDGETLEAEVRYVARHEMVETLCDIVLRRLDLGTQHGMSTAMLESCAALAAAELGWSSARRQTEIARVRASYPFASPASQSIGGAPA